VLNRKVTSIFTKAIVGICVGGFFLCGILYLKGYIVYMPREKTVVLMPRIKYHTTAIKRQSEAYRQYLYGLLYERKGMHNEAIEKFRLAKRYDQDSILNRLHLGVNMVNAGMKKEAAQLFDETSNLHPGNSKVQILTAFLFASQNKYPEAIAQFERILANDPENIFILSSIADLHVLFDKLDKAAETYKRIIEIKPNHSFILFNLAVIESRLKHYDTAQHYLEKAIEAKPDYIDAHSMLGLVYEMQLKFEEAITAFNKAIDLDPINTGIYHNLARLYYVVGRGDDAIAQYYLILKLDPRDVNAALDLAYLYIQREKYDESVSVVRDILKNGVVHPKLYFMKGYALASLSSEEEKDSAKLDQSKITRKNAIRSFLDSLVVDPDYADAHFYLGILLEKQKDYETAKYHLKRTIEIDPANAEAFNYLAYMDIEQGINLDEAIVYVKKALELDPDNAAFIDSLGWAYYKKGIYDQAITQLETAVALSDKDAVIREHLGDAYQKIGHLDKAIQEWQEVLSIEPGNKSAKQKLKEIIN
jgi:tetratricopeptide (TPR) repeat protein